MCISGQRSLKSHHLGDKQALAFLLYEETGRFSHEPEKLFCCITLQTFGRQTSLSLSWGPDILHSQAKKAEREAAEVQRGENNLPHVAPNFHDSKTQGFLVFTPAPSTF